MNLKGIVLAGGRSRRFGSDKALAAAGSMTMIEKTIALLKELGLEPVIVTHESADYSFLKCAILRDLISNQGPLGGLYTAMMAYKNSSLLVLTCDMPYMTLSVLRSLLRSHKSKNLATIYCVSADDRIHSQYQPFPGVYESSIVGQIVSSLKKKKLSMRHFLDTLPQKRLIPYKFPLEHIRNINTTSEL